MSTEKKKPAHKIKNGSLTVTIWKNSGEKGDFYTINPTRSYKDGDQWKETTSFHHHELLTLAKMLDQAETWISQEYAKSRQSRSDDQTGHAEHEEERRSAGGQQR